MGFIHKRDREVDATLKSLGSQVKMTEETDETDSKVVLLIRERYSLSKELCLHRKKLIGTVDAQEWSAYVDYVLECIAKVDAEVTE